MKHTIYLYLELRDIDAASDIMAMPWIATETVRCDQREERGRWFIAMATEVQGTRTSGAQPRVRSLTDLSTAFRLHR